MKPSCVGDEAQPIANGFIPRAVAQESSVRQMAAMNDLPRKLPRIPVTTILSETLHELLLIGAPKSGKSTVIQRLVHQVAMGKLEVYQQAIAINLADYAQMIEQRPSLSLLTYFCLVTGCRDHQASETAVGIRQLADRSQRFVLLLDDWDKVPQRQREIVRERIEGESCYMTTLVASRPAGSSYFRNNGTRTKRVILSELEPEVAFHAVMDYASRGGNWSKQGIDRVAVELHASYQAFTKHPHWINQTMCIANASLQHRTPFHSTLHAKQILRWAVGSAEGFSMPSKLIEVLERLSYQMVFSGERPRTTFFVDELERIASDLECDHEQILKCDLIHQTSSVLDQHAISFVSVRDYLAGCAFAGKSDADESFDAAMSSTERFDVLVHAGRIMGSRDRQLRGHAVRWLKKREQGHTILLRLARLAEASGWTSDDGDGLLGELCEKMRIAIGGTRDRDAQLQLRNAISRLCRPTLRGAASRRQLQGLAGWDGSLSEQGQEVEVLEDDSKLSREPSEEKPISRLASFVCLHPNDGSVGLELERLDSYQARALTDVLADLVCDQAVVRENRAACLARLVVDGDTAVLARRSSEMIPAIGDDLASEMMELVASNHAKGSHAFTPFIAIAVKNDWKVSTEKLINAIVTSIRLSPTPEMTNLLSRELIRHLQTKSTELTSLQRLTDPLSELAVGPLIDDTTKVPFFKIWKRLIRQVTSDDPLAPESLLSLKLAALMVRTLSVDVSEIHLSEALRAVSEAAPQANQSLDSSPNVFAENQVFPELSTTRLGAIEILVEHLLAVAPAVLLKFARQNHGVKQVLCRCLSRRQWLWLDDHLIDDRGRWIANEPRDECQPAPLSTPDAVQEIATTLPHRQRSDFLSYWYMVSEGDEAYRSYDRETIYRDIRVVMESSALTPLGHRLASCYGDGSPPAFATWRKNLSRVIQRCESNPRWAAYLDEIGLGIRRRKPR